MPPDERVFTVRVRLLEDTPGPPRRVGMRLDVYGLSPGETGALTLALYDGAARAEEGGQALEPGRYRVIEVGLSADRPVLLTLLLPTAYSGWAVRELKASGWAWPFTVEADGPEAPGSTPAGAREAQDERFLARGPEPGPVVPGSPGNRA